MYTTRSSRHMGVKPSVVYRALLDAAAISKCRVPAGMRGEVHSFEARQGGTFRISLTYDSPTASGKSEAHTDTYHGHFFKLVPNEQVVEVLEFETADPALQGEMTMTTTLVESHGGTDVVVVHEGVPDVVPAADNAEGTRMALDSLAALVEGGFAVE
jgi:uncharacterized protein YndB with AHSA1/START domain